MATGVTVAASGSSTIDSLLYGTKWSTGTLTYAFPAAASEVTGYDTSLVAGSFTGLTPTEQAAIEFQLAAWASVANLSFSSAAPGSADLRFYRYEADNPTARVVAFPGATAEAGDVQLGTAVSGDFTSGLYQAFTLLHEIGHALGLKHPHDAVDGFPAAHAGDDGLPLSVMSYRSYIGGPTTGYSVADGSYPVGPMIDDIAALQYLYGPNWGTNTNDTVYTFDPASPVVFSASWDAGGIDTYNLANYTTALQISLQPGEWSRFGIQYAVLDSAGPVVHAAGNVANPYLYQGDTRSLIENVTAGSGNDTIVGNVADNRLQGNAGADSLSGGDGQDTLIGGAGDDSLLGGADDDSLDGGPGADWLEGGAGSDILLGGDDADTILGGDGSDSLNGGAGNDSLVAGEGGDGLLGGLGDDTLEGGAGTDHLLGNDGADVLLGGDDNDTLEGGADADSLDGGAGADILSGGDGDDTMIGGAGADTLKGEGGDDTLTGGDGDDVFVFAAVGAGSDTIVDFTGGDVIRITGAQLSGQVTAGDGTDVAAGAAQVGPVANGVTTLHLDIDGVIGADLVLRLGGTFTSGDLLLSGTDVTYAPPPPPPSGGGSSSPPPVTSTEDGARVTRSTTTAPGGGPQELQVIAPITTTREEDPTSPDAQRADVMLAADGGTSRAALMAGLPVGVGMTVEGVAARLSRDQALVDLIARIDQKTAAGSGPRQEMADVGKAFLEALPTASLFVKTVMPTLAPGAAAPTTPIVITGEDVADRQEALVIDVRGLPSGTILQLDGVDFAAVVGAVEIRGGSGRNIVAGDDAAQIIVLGPDDDVLRGGGGDDTIGSEGGRDILFGDAGNDTVFGGNDHDFLVGGAGDDVLRGDAGMDAALHSGAHADYMITRGLDRTLTITGADGNDRLESVDILVFADRVDLAHAPDITAAGFDAAAYVAANPDVAAALAAGQFASAHQHFSLHGEAEGRAPSALFDVTWYLAKNTDVAAAVAGGTMTAWQHYQTWGSREGRDPGPFFDQARYLEQNPDVAAAGLDPLVHYLQWGWSEGRAAYQSDMTVFG